MGYPMILPWLARKSGVSIPLAEGVWDRCLADADRRFPGGMRGHAYWRYVLRAFRAALAAHPSKVAPDSGVLPGLGAGWGLYLLQIQLANQAWWAWMGVLRKAWTSGPKTFFPWSARA